MDVIFEIDRRFALALSCTLTPYLNVPFPTPTSLFISILMDHSEKGKTCVGDNGDSGKTSPSESPWRLAQLSHLLAPSLARSRFLQLRHSNLLQTRSASHSALHADGELYEATCDSQPIQIYYTSTASSRVSLSAIMLLWAAAGGAVYAYALLQIKVLE